MLAQNVVAVLALAITGVSARRGHLPTFKTAPVCGNNARAYCCNGGADCQVFPDGRSASQFCTGGVAICCTQNAGVNDIQLCIGQIIGNLTINIYGCGSTANANSD